MKNSLMFIAMKRLKIVPGHEKVFKELWRKRETHLNGVKGFQSFNLIKGQRAEY